MALFPMETARLIYRRQCARCPLRSTWSVGLTDVTGNACGTLTEATAPQFEATENTVELPFKSASVNV